MLTKVWETCLCLLCFLGAWPLSHLCFGERGLSLNFVFSVFFEGVACPSALCFLCFLRAWPLNFDFGGVASPSALVLGAWPLPQLCVFGVVASPSAVVGAAACCPCATAAQT